MKNTRIRIFIGVLALFVALTAIGGGIAMLAGVDRFPHEWLRDTPFSDYTIPALVLTVIVGGSSLLAAVTMLRKQVVGVLMSVAAGLILAFFIVVEVIILKQVPPGPTLIEVVYFGLGLAVFGLTAYIWIVEHRHQRRTVR